MECQGPCLPHCTNVFKLGIFLLLVICILLIIRLGIEYRKNNKKN